MSTKTTFKRIALVAAASLGLGLISAVPSAQAYVTGTPTVTVTNGTATVGKSDSTTAATIALTMTTNTADAVDTAVISVTGVGNYPTGATWDTNSIRLFIKDTSTGTMVGTPTRKMSEGGTSQNWVFGREDGTTFESRNPRLMDAQVILTKGASTASNVGVTIGYNIDTAVARIAGTYVFNYSIQYYYNGLQTSLGNAGTASIVVSADGTAATGAVTAAGTSSAVLYSSGGVQSGNTYHANNTIDSTLSLVSDPDGTADAVIYLTQLTAAGLPSRESITVTIDKGNVSQNNATAAAGKSVTFVGSATGKDFIYIFADGSSGTATITLKTTSVTFANKTLTWYSTTVATISATVLAKTVGSTATYAVLAVAKDALGNQITDNTSVYYYSSNRDVISSGSSTTTGTACSYFAAYGGQLCSVTASSNGTADITLRNKSTTATSTVSSTAVTLTGNVNSPVALKLETNKDTYAAGEAIYLRVWAVDSSGKPVGGGTFTNLLASGGITADAALGTSSDTTTAVTFDLGFTTSSSGYASQEPIKLYKLYAPFTSGTIKFSATGGALLPAAGQVAVTKSITVANAADANASAALAAVTALASQVSAFITKINAQITTLTDLVMKIQKKVKA